MSRIFWDATLIIYLLEDHPIFGDRAEALAARARRRRDALFTSYLTLGEVLAALGKSPDPKKTAAVRESLDEMGFSFLPFDDGAVVPFSKLRADYRLKIADSIHLACAASAGIDLFLTGDKQLTELDVPGIQFIADFTTPIL
jgi:predicted nucleic acid-binding protein